MKQINTEREIEFLESTIKALKEGKVTPSGYVHHLIWHGCQRMQHHELDIKAEDFSAENLESLQWTSIGLDTFCHSIPEDKKVKRLDYSECPCCSDSSDIREATGTLKNGEKVVFKRCWKCGALFGVFPSYEATLEVVKDQFFDPNAYKKQRYTTVYFDFMWPDTKYPDGRRHGWFEPTTRTVTQAG